MLFGNQNGRDDLGDIDAVAMILLKSIKKKQVVKMKKKYNFFRKQINCVLLKTSKKHLSFTNEGKFHG